MGGYAGSIHHHALPPATSAHFDSTSFGHVPATLSPHPLSFYSTSSGAYTLERNMKYKRRKKKKTKTYMSQSRRSTLRSTRCHFIDAIHHCPSISNKRPSPKRWPSVRWGSVEDIIICPLGRSALFRGTKLGSGMDLEKKNTKIKGGLLGGFPQITTGREGD